MENFQQWDFCDFQGEECIIYDMDEKIITLAIWESSYRKVPLHSISSSLLTFNPLLLNLKERVTDEANALLQLCQPTIMSLSGHRVALNPSQSLVCLNEQNKAYSFSGLFSTVHASANENGYMSDEFGDEEYLSLGAVVQDRNGMKKKIALDNFMTHFRANTRNERDLSTLRSMRVISLKM